MIINVVGARPNFMKMAPVIKALNKLDLPNIVVHTGQHYNSFMSKDILKDLKISEPDYFLNIRGGSHATQTAKIMIEFEKICMNINPKIVVVAGDVNSTLACAIVASKLNIPLAHVESGLRSFDKTMPEEINRILTDHISRFLFTTEESANLNLMREGINKKSIHFVGNCMIDSLKTFLPSALKSKPWEKFGLKGEDYALATIHRPSNVDNEESLQKIVEVINNMSKKLKIVFPLHPRTKNNIDLYDMKFSRNVICTKPLAYIDFLGLMAKSFIVVTDSGGIQEETTILKIPCLTLRDNTERPVTVDIGTNIITGTDSEEILKIFDHVINKKTNLNKIRTPVLWDGNSGMRIAKKIKSIYYDN